MLKPKKSESRRTYLARAEKGKHDLLEASHAWRLANDAHYDLDMPAGTETALLENADDSIRLMVAGVVEDVRASAAAVMALRSEPEADAEVEINSCGGSFDQGMQIHNALVDHLGTTVAKITGQAASTALTIAMGCDQIVAHENTSIMMHPARAVALLAFVGLDKSGIDRAESIKEMADKGTEQLISLLSARSGQTEDTVREMVTARSGAGTTLTATEAKEMGFVDAIIENKQRHSTTNMAFQAWKESELLAIEVVDLELQGS